METCQPHEIVNNCRQSTTSGTTGNHPRKSPRLNSSAVLERFDYEVLDFDRCREVLIGLLHPRGLVCGKCGHDDFSGIQEASFNRFGRVQCGGCGRFFTAKTGTVLEGSSLTERQVVMLAACVGLGLPGSEIAGLVRVHPETIRRWRAKLG